jgi:hypothetical protein
MFNTPSLQISPNPASMQFNVGINGSNKNDRWTMQITDYLGKSVMQKDINGGGMLQSIDISSLDAGVYIVQVINNGTLLNKKLVIK